MKFNNILAQQAYDEIHSLGEKEVKKLLNIATKLPPAEMFLGMIQVGNFRMGVAILAIQSASDVEAKLANSLMDFSAMVKNTMKPE